MVEVIVMIIVIIYFLGLSITAAHVIRLDNQNLEDTLINEITKDVTELDAYKHTLSYLDEDESTVIDRGKLIKVGIAVGCFSNSYKRDKYDKYKNCEKPFKQQKKINDLIDIYIDNYDNVWFLIKKYEFLMK